MDRQMLWQLFLDTGAPEIYLLYKNAQLTEDIHVLDDQGTCSSGVCL